MNLDWQPGEYRNVEAVLKNPDETVGVRFSLDVYPTCFRRGPYRLLIDVESGPYHIAWGCFDHQDQPMRWYHSKDTAMSEAQAIADVFVRDFKPECFDGR